MLIQSEIPDLNDLIQLQKDDRNEQIPREPMQQVQINDNLLRQRNFGSNTETPAPRKNIGLYDDNNPYRDFGTESLQSR